MSSPWQPIPGRPMPLSDSLRIVAGAARRTALFPQLFPIPDPVRHLVRQRESELMRKHTHLPAMVGFVRKHVAQHFRANRPRRSPAVSRNFATRPPPPPSASASISAQRAALSANPARACGGVSTARIACLCGSLGSAGSRRKARSWESCTIMTTTPNAEALGCILPVGRKLKTEILACVFLSTDFRRVVDRQ